MNNSELAEAFCVTRVTSRKWIEKGMLTTSLSDAAKWILKNANRISRQTKAKCNEYCGEGATEAELDEKETLERLRLQKINRNLDLKFERENGTLVPRDKAEAIQIQHIEIVQSVVKSFLPRDQYNACIRQLKASLKGIEL